MQSVLYIQSSLSSGPLIARHTPAVEQLSADSFLAAIARGKLGGLVRELAGRDDHPFVIGIGPNPLLAGAAVFAREYGRPPGVKAYRCGKGLILDVRPESVPDFVAHLPVECFWPLPEKVRQGLKKMGFLRGEDLQRAGRQELGVHFGIFGPMIAEFSRGLDRRVVAATYPVPEAVWETTCEELTNATAVMALLEQGAAALAEELWRRQAACKRLLLQVETANGTMQAERSLPGAAPEAHRLKLLLALLWRGMDINAPVTGLCLKAEPCPLTGEQLNLLSYRQLRRKEHMDRAVAFVDRRHPGVLGTAGALALENRRERVRALFPRLI